MSPAGGRYVHRGTDELHALYPLFFSNGGGIPLEHCTATDGRACAPEYNVVAVYVRGNHSKLATARNYDDSDPPVTAHQLSS